ETDDKKDDQPDDQSEKLLGFQAVEKSLLDKVVVPAGYTATVLYALGDPLDPDVGEYQNDGSDTSFDRRAGDHHDGIEYFGLSEIGTAPDLTNSSRGLLAMNHEATSHASSEWASAYLHTEGGTPTGNRPTSEIDKEVAAHGVSIVEVERNGGSFSYLVRSLYNRRITPLTPVELSGQAADSPMM